MLILYHLSKQKQQQWKTPAVENFPMKLNSAWNKMGEKQEKIIRRQKLKLDNYKYLECWLLWIKNVFPCMFISQMKKTLYLDSVKEKNNHNITLFPWKMVIENTFHILMSSH